MAALTMPSALIPLADSPQPATLVRVGDSGYGMIAEALHDEVAFLNNVKALVALGPGFSPSSDRVAAEKAAFMAQKAAVMEADEITEQARAVYDDLTRDTRLVVVTGPPGAAKSTVTAMWTRLARQHDPRVPLLITTQEKGALVRLHDKIGLRPVHALALDVALDTTVPWPEHALVIVDEAGLLGTRSMADLLGRAVASQAQKVVLIGDDKQLLPEDTGQPFRWLRQSAYAQNVALTHPFRQKTPLLRQIVRDLSLGDTAAALADQHPYYKTGAELIKTTRELLDYLPPESTYVLVHGPQTLREQLAVRCPGFRHFSLAEAQGLAVDHVVLVIGQPIHQAALLVGCSRQRHRLDVVVDARVYPDHAGFISNVAPFPRHLMALDVLPEDQVLALV